MRLELSSPFTNQEIESHRVATIPKVSLLVRDKWFQSACSNVLLGQVKVVVYTGGKESETRNESLDLSLAQVTFISCTRLWKSHDVGPPVSVWKTKIDTPPPLSSWTALLRVCARVGIWSGTGGAKAPGPRTAHRHVSLEIFIKPSCTSGSHSLVHSGQLAHDLESLFQKNGNKVPR